MLEFKWLKLLYSNNSLETFLEINKITISPRDPRQILPVWSDTEITRRTDQVMTMMSGYLSRRHGYPYPKVTSWDLRKITLFRIFSDPNISGSLKEK